MLLRKDHYDYTRSSSLQKYIVLQRTICMVTTLRIYLNSYIFLLTERGDWKPWKCEFSWNSFVHFFIFESGWFFAEKKKKENQQLLHFHIQVNIWPTKLEGTAIKRNLFLDHIGYSWCSWYQRRGNDFSHIYLAINGKQLINISSEYTWTIHNL